MSKSHTRYKFAMVAHAQGDLSFDDLLNIASEAKLIAIKVRSDIASYRENHGRKERMATPQQPISMFHCEQCGCELVKDRRSFSNGRSECSKCIQVLEGEY